MSRLSEQKYLNHEGQVSQWPSSQKDKLLVLSYLASKFNDETVYTEAQVNALLKQWHTFSDWSLLRRELVDRVFLNRTTNGSEYRVYAIPTTNPAVRLLIPSVERDATVAAGWLEGPEGRDTLRLMGNTDADNQPSSPECEADRIRDFIIATDQLTWAIRYQNQTVGCIWVDYEPTQHVPAPAVHIMLGDPAARGKGVGLAALQAVIGVLQRSGKYQHLYSRHLTANPGAAKLLAKAGFTDLDAEYADQDDLRWQNMRLDLETTI